MDTPTPNLIAITGGNLSGRRGPQFSAVGTVRNAKSIRILMIHLPTHYPPRARTQKLSRNHSNTLCLSFLFGSHVMIL